MTNIIAPANPFTDHMGIKLVSWIEGEAHFEMPIQPWHMNRQGALQGGVVSTLVDVACGYSGMFAEPGQPPIQAVTITLNVNFVASVNQGILHVHGKKIGGGRRIFFAEAQVLTHEGILIASGQASFKYRSPIK